MLMLNGADYHKFRDLKEELDNDFAKGTDTYLMNHNAVLGWMNSQNSRPCPDNNTDSERNGGDVCSKRWGNTRHKNLF